MRKLFAFLLAVCLLLPACAPAEDRDPIVGCWYMYIDGEKYPEFMQNYGKFDTALSVYYFLSGGTIMLLENDVVNGSSQPTFASVGKWEKSGDGYQCSIFGLGTCTLTLLAESAMLSPESYSGLSMKLRQIRLFNPYSDYVFTR